MAAKRDRHAIVWLDEAARRLGVSEDYLREGVAAGDYPAPRGVGNRLFYTEEDMDGIVLFFGRWRVQEKPGKVGKNPEKPGKGRKDPESEGQAG